MIPPPPLVHHHHDGKPLDILAKRLNNQAALCIESGRYDRAVSNLVKALSLTKEQQIDNTNPTTCTCKHCCLEECISFSEVPPLVRYDSKLQELIMCTTSTKRSGTEEKYPARRRQKSIGERSRPCEEDSDEERFIYRQPIRITPQSMQGKGHCMGVTLPLILSFNLALAYHLNALDSSSMMMNRSRTDNELQVILKLYEIAYILHDKEKKKQDEWDNINNQQQSGGSSSIRFDMILANNLGEIHLMVGNHSKHTTCLQLLLSATMYIVDCGIQNDYSMELEGFFRNTYQLILRGHNAAAA